MAITLKKKNHEKDHDLERDDDDDDNVRSVG